MADGQTNKLMREAELEAERVRAAVAKNVRRWRERAKVSQTKLSEQTGISISYVSMIERGQRFPQPEILIVIANALGRRWLDAYRTA